MKKILLIISSLSLAVFCFAKGGFDDGTIPDYAIVNLKQEIQQNHCVKNVEIIKRSPYAKNCDAEIILKNGGYLYFEHIYNTPYECLSKIGDYLIIDWSPFCGKLNESKNESYWNLSLGWLVVADLNLLLGLETKLTRFDIINNYNEYYNFILNLPDCPFGLSEESFVIPLDSPLIFPEKWYDYDSPYTFERGGRPHKIFKLKAEDFDAFVEAQNFNEYKIKRFTHWKNN